MNPEIKAQWVAALRSGEYEQGKRALSVNNQYCCLGVLCDLAEKAGVVESTTDTIEDPTDPFGDHRVPVKFYGRNSASSFLPKEVVDWSEADDGIVDVSTPDGHFGLHILNDQGNTFAEIADFIEQDTEL